MKVRETPLSGVLVFESSLYHDSRGYFLEMGRQDALQEAGIDHPLVQTNRSFSHAGVLRGLHFQNPSPQGKFVSVAYGSVFDVAVDIRPDSPTFKKWFGELLSAENGLSLWIPIGFAHGFAALTEAVLVYQVTDYYNPRGDATLLWNDPEIGIQWPISDPVISAKDAEAPALSALDPQKLAW